VEWGDRPLPIPRRQVRALLYRLAADRPAIPREALCFLLWPDVPEAQARRSFSSLLSHLRRALPAPGIVLTAQDHVTLNAQEVWSDARAFDALCAGPAPMDALQRAVALYRGPLLTGFSLPGHPEFEAWIVQARQDRERTYLEALAQLIELHAARHELAAAIACARRYLATDDLAEDVHRRLIELYAANGDRGAAAQQYERCAIVLERELGLSPLPETRAAYEALRQPAPVRPARALPAPAWTTLPTLDAPLIGREAALQSLTAAYADARRGRGRVILISGEPGIGKSRLMEHFVTPHTDEATVLVGSGHETAQGVPYAPLIEALRPTLTGGPPDIEPLYVAAVARLMPELHRHRPDLPAPHPLEPTQRQAYLFRALTRYLSGLAARRPPLILCVDDLHGCDRATRAYLAHLARQLAATPVLLLGTYRTEGETTVAALRAALRRLDGFAEIRLPGLTPTHIRRLIRHLSARSQVAEELSARLHRESGGNPFFLLELLRALFETGVLRQDEGGWNTRPGASIPTPGTLPLPDTVSEAIRERLRRLPAAARQVLEAGAVLGVSFEHDLVDQTSGRGEEEVVEALDALLKRQLLVEEGGAYRFIHALTRDVVYGDLSYGRRRLLHRRAGRALETLEPERSVALAHHFERGERMERAITYLIEAGEKALRVAAPQEACAHLSRARALFDTLPADPRRARQELRLHLTLGVALQIAHGYGNSEAGRVHARARALCYRLGDTAHLFATLGLLLMFHATNGDQRAAREIGVELLEVATQAEDPDWMMVSHWQLGVQRLAAGELVEARAHLEEATARYDQRRHHKLTFRFGLEPGVMSLAALSWVLWNQGYLRQAQTRSREAIALAEALAYPPGVAVAQSYASALAIFRRDEDAALTAARTVSRISKEHGLLYWRATGLTCMGWVWAQRGRPERGLRLIRRGRDAGGGTDAGMFTLLEATFLGEVYTRAGRPERALAILQGALATANRTGERFYEPEVHRLIATLVPEEDEAEAHLRRAIATARAQGARSLELRAALDLCRLWRARGEHEAAGQLLAPLYGWFGTDPAEKSPESPDLREARTILGL
jgi:adenylate cyclase